MARGRMHNLAKCWCLFCCNTTCSRSNSNTKEMSVFALLERLAPHIEKEVNLVINSKQEAETLSSRLRKIQVGLQDAERKGVTNNSIKDWLKQLEDVTYEMDDVLDEWQTANLQIQVESSEDFSDPWQKVRSLVLSLCFCFKHVVGRRGITKKMKFLSDRIDNILKERGQYSFVSSENDLSQEFKHEESTSLVNKFQVYGRDTGKDSLVEKLVSERQENNDGTQIISIVGIGGVGKTTLAQLAYNDPEVDGLFTLKAWVSVSEPFDASAIARAILEAFGETLADTHKLETLVQLIKKAVENQRFLLVLDNVWTEDRMKWECLKNCLHGAKGSIILVTTRSESVARMMGTAQWQPLGLLSDLDCGRILNGVALEGRTREECEKLRDIGIEIAKKCNGLPLAARTVGSMLALRVTEQEWRAVLESPFWKYEDKVTDLFRLLNLSYIDLSPLLKRCFLSCVVYPKGSLINVDILIRIWMAYGYLSSNGSVDEVQLKGLHYFNNLATRSFFQKLESDEDDGIIISYKMHDVMHDFANYLSGSEYSCIMDGGGAREKSLPSRRALYNLPWNSLGRLRTFCARCVSQEELPLDILSHLRSVRVLSMSDCNLEVLPEEVGKLIHLRYLDLSYNPIKELPETVINLYNLQTLDLENCPRLSSLPQGIDKLINLRHLLNSGAHGLFQFPQGLEKLTGLWTLSEFNARASRLGYLRNLNQLQGSLSLSLQGLNETANSLEEVREAKLGNKNHIKKLKLFFYDEDLTDDIVDALQPPPNLQTLVIHGSTGKWLSNWIDRSFNKLKILEFDGRQICSDLPTFGKLPSLEKLQISNCSFKCVSREFLGIKGAVADASIVSKAQSPVLPSTEGIGWFPRLKKLHFQSCNSWQDWEDIREEAQDSVPILPCLEELKIIGCRILEVLPHGLLRQATSLQFFEFSSCRNLEDRYYRGLGGSDWYKISHIPRVKCTTGLIRSKTRIAFLAYTSALRFRDKLEHKKIDCED